MVIEDTDGPADAKKWLSKPTGGNFDVLGAMTPGRPGKQPCDQPDWNHHQQNGLPERQRRRGDGQSVTEIGCGRDSERSSFQHQRPAFTGGVSQWNNGANGVISYNKRQCRVGTTVTNAKLHIASPFDQMVWNSDGPADAKKWLFKPTGQF